MTGIAKTPEELVKEFKNQPWQFVDNKSKPLSHRELALTAASSLPNQSIGELLQNAEKIEWWLNKPEMDSRKMVEEFNENLYKYWMKTTRGEFTVHQQTMRPNEKQKSPETNSEAFDGVSGD